MLIATGTTARPLHAHDCDCCVFLGQVGRKDRRDTELQDVWYCKQEQVLILRFGVNGDYQTVHTEFNYPAEHPSHDAWNLVQNWQLEGSPTQELEAEAEDEWAGYENVVGLYKDGDLRVKETEKNIFIRDWHGNPLGVARKGAVHHLGNDDSKEYRFRPYEGLELCNLPMEKAFYSKKALYLYCMWIQQELLDAGH